VIGCLRCSQDGGGGLRAEPLHRLSLSIGRDAFVLHRPLAFARVEAAAGPDHRRGARAVGSGIAILLQRSALGNTSSASMLIAATEWWRERRQLDGPIIFAAFGAGLHWGSLLACGAG
jgi:hypothetical protein